MKRQLPVLFLFAFLFNFFAGSQDLKELKIVGTAKKLSSEMVARQDQNGDYCAAIQVISDLDGFSYDSNDGIVGNIENNPGKDMVYLTSTERVLEVFKSGYKPLKLILSEFGVRLQPKIVWQITIAGDEGTETLPVTLRLEPADALIFIDGKQVTGNTHKLSRGQHSIKIEKQGYVLKEETVLIDDEHVFFEWKLDKQPDAAVQIETVPAGATIYLDGIKLGNSPISAFYPPGNYSLKITKEGCVTIEDQMIEIILPTTKKSYTLEENVGYLTVNTHIGAKVYFNDQLMSNPKNVKLTPQLVKVKVTMPKADPIEQQVVLKKDDDLSLNLYPELKTGTIQVAVTPFDAKIKLSGDAGESYSANGMKIFENIPIGTYTIKVSATNYTTKTESVNLANGIKENVNIQLEEISSSESTSNMVEEFDFEPESDAPIFTVVESMPGYPGGDAARMQYLNQNIKYPAIAKESGIQGRVFVTFVVEQDGSLSNVKVLRGIGGGCDEEAVRVIKSMPKWTPGKQRGEPVRVQYNMPLKFTLN